MDTEETSGGSDFKSAFGGALGNLLSDLLKSTGIPLPLAVPCVIMVLVLLNSFKQKSVGILLVVPCAIMILVLLPFFKEQKRLKELCKKVREEREAGQCPPDTELLRNAECLRDNWLYKLVNKLLCKRMESSRTLEALLKELENAYVVFGASTFLKCLEDRCQGVNNQSRPSVESDMSGEDTEPREVLREVLVQKIVKHFSDWREEFRPDDKNLYIKWIGANDIALVSATLHGFADNFPNGRIDVYVPRSTVTSANRENLKRIFKSNTSKVVIAESPYDGYDIVISTHFWQHHSKSVVENEKLELLMTDGLFVLLAAISRDPKADEYVCEGWAPMKAKVKKDKSDHWKDIYWVSFLPMGEYSKPLNICYHWSKEFEDHTPVLSWGFPKSVAVDKDVVSKGKELSEWIRAYFQWESDNGWHASVDGVDRQPPVTVGDVQILARAQAKSDAQADAATDSVTEYLLMEFAYSVDAADANTKARENPKLPIIACVGYEENQWRSGQIGNKVPITFHPAHAVRLKEGNKLLEQVLLAAGLKSVIDRYKPYIPNSPCASGCNGGRVWRIHTRIYEADLNDFLVFENGNGQSGGRVFYSYLPKRRYLTEEGYTQGLQMLDAYKKWTKESRVKSSVYGDSLLRFDSVTWLWSYQQLLAFCRKRKLQINAPDHDLYFHKVYCELSDKDADNKVLMKMQSRSERNSLCNKQCCVAKDEAFNKLPVNDRIQLLARLNVHDVLLFARKEAKEA